MNLKMMGGRTSSRKVCGSLRILSGMPGSSSRRYWALGNSWRRTVVFRRDAVPYDHGC